MGIRGSPPLWGITEVEHCNEGWESTLLHADPFWCISGAVGSGAETLTDCQWAKRRDDHGQQADPGTDGTLLQASGEGVVTRPNFQAFLENPGRFLAGFPISYDQSLGLMVLIQQAVGERNFGNISRDITPERFPLKGIGVRTVKARVEPYLDEETSEQAAVRLIAAGYNLGNTGDLAAFLHDYPGEVEKWVWVLAISEDSRWAGPGGRVCVPYAFVRGAGCGFYPHALRNQLNSRCGALVLSE